MNVKITEPNGSTIFEADAVGFNKKTRELRVMLNGVATDHVLDEGFNAYVTNAKGETIERYQGRRPTAADHEAIVAAAVGPTEWPPLMMDRVTQILTDDGAGSLCIGGFQREDGGATGLAIWPSGQLENRRTFYSFDVPEMAREILKFADLGRSALRLASGDHSGRPGAASADPS